MRLLHVLPVRHGALRHVSRGLGATGSLLAIVALVLALGAPPASADPIIFGSPVNPGGMFTINTTTGQCIQWVDGAGVYETLDDGNHLAYDFAQGRILHSLNVDDDWRIFSRNVTLDAYNNVTGISDPPTTLIANLRAAYAGPPDLWPGGSSSTLYDLTGAACSPTGILYTIPDRQGTGSGNSAPYLLWMTFTPGGAVNTVGRYKVGDTSGHCLG